MNTEVVYSPGGGPPRAAGWWERAADLAYEFVETRRSPHTRTAYRTDLRTWLTWCAETDLDPFAARETHVQQWNRVRTELGDKESTRARRVSALFSWYRWLGRRGEIGHNPADLDRDDRPHAPTTSTAGIALTKAQFRELVARADADTPLVSALVAILGWSGSRVSAITNARMSGLGEWEGQPVLKVTVKGGEETLIPLVPDVYIRLSRYLASRNDLPSRLPTHTPGVAGDPLVFVGVRSGRQISTKWVANVLNGLATGTRRPAGEPKRPVIVKHLAPHDMRRGANTLWRAAGASLEERQRALGHKDPKTTQRYDRTSAGIAAHPAYRLTDITDPTSEGTPHAMAS